MTWLMREMVSFASISVFMASLVLLACALVG